MVCPKCGASHFGNFCPQCGSPTDGGDQYPRGKAPAKPKKRRLGLNIFLGVTAALLFFGAVGALTEPSEPAAPAAQAKPAPVSQAAPPPAPSAYGIEQKATVGDVSVTWLGITASNGSGYFQPAAGNVFVYLELLIENNSASDVGISSLLSFSTYFDDYATELSFTALSAKSNLQQLDGLLTAGKKLKGVIAYEVPANWKTVEINVRPELLGGALTFRAQRKNPA